jgi:hypothetical protein
LKENRNTFILTIKRLVLSIVALHAVTAMASDILFIKTKDDVAVRVTSPSYPQDLFTKKLKSGLPVNLSSFTVLSEGAKEIITSFREIVIVYDLWDEVFNVKIKDNQSERNQKIKSENSVKELFFNFDAALLKPITISKGKIYDVKVSLVLNPLDEKKIENLQRIISENCVGADSSRGQTGSGGGVGLRATPHTHDVHGNESGPRFKKLFNTILKQYTENGQRVGLWQVNYEARLKNEESK